MSKTFTYESDSITVKYDVRKCIHAAACVHGNSEVFDPKRRPWVDPAKASADEIAETIEQCPSGALQYLRNDNGSPEMAAESNSVLPNENGPLVVRGNIEILDQQGAIIESGKRFTLCRCGQSANKPFCDNSHAKIEFVAGVTLGAGGIKEADISRESGALTITASTNGPLLFKGPVSLRSTDGAEVRSGLKCALCRCGHSSNKPFCDGSHRVEGFTSS